MASIPHAQAARGRTAFQQHCAECHGGSLEGAEAVALKGDRFNLSWKESTVDRLFKQVSADVPASEDGSLAGTLARGTYVDIVALVLQSNGFSTGCAELRPETPPAWRSSPRAARGNWRFLRRRKWSAA